MPSCRTLYRLFVSRSYLLEWRTASQARQPRQRLRSPTTGMMYGAVLIGASRRSACCLPGGNRRRLRRPSLRAVLDLSPAVAWYVSRSAETEDRLVMSPRTRAELRTIARRTWRYFETFVDGRA